MAQIVGDARLRLGSKLLFSKVLTTSLGGGTVEADVAALPMVGPGPSTRN